MKTMRFIALVLLLALAFVPTQAVSAKGLPDGKVIFGDTFTLKSGETLDGDLVVFAGAATIEGGAKVNGNVAITGGSLTVDGEVNGDVVIVGGAVKLGEAAVVHGNLTTIGASLDKTEGARVEGQILNTATTWETGNGNHPQTPNFPQPPEPPRFWIDFNPFKSVANMFMQALGMVVLAILVAMFLAPQTERVARAMIVQPVIASGMGLLTIVLFPLAMVLMVITILLIPVAAATGLLLGLAIIYGWIALGLELGQRFTRVINRTWHPALAAGFGTFVLSLISSALASVPVVNCIGWLVPFVVTLLAIGGVIMTRFGTRAIEMSAIATVPVEPMAPAVPVLPVELPVAPPEPPKAQKGKK